MLINHTEIQNHLTRKYEKLATRNVQLAKYELNWTRKLKLATRTFQLATRNLNLQLELATRTRNSNSQLATRRIPWPHKVWTILQTYDDQIAKEFCLEVLMLSISNKAHPNIQW